jgi:N-acetylglucosaminyldiphosphoundecaprenol N-acetyl-beta-D-mannosaminyltransferase
MSTRVTTGSHQDSMAPPILTVSLMGLRLACVDWRGLVDHIFGALEANHGGWVITANLDFLRRHVRDPEARSLYDSADIRVADGMPLVWACWLQGDKLPERVPGSSLVWPLVERAAREGRSVYLLGGASGVNVRAAKVLAEKYPSLKLCGGSSPIISSPPSPSEIETVLSELTRARPDILLVALGSPKQEQLIRVLRDHLPSTWMVGVGISFSFIAGDLKRAPEWMCRIGIEWVHRMLQEPRRLVKRYLLDDLPFALQLFPNALWVRLNRSR